MSEKPLWYRWARVGFVGASIIATGLVLFKYTTPTDEELISQFSPEIRRDYERNKALRQKEQEQVMRNAQLTAASKDPIWKTGAIKSPWDKENRGDDPNLINPEAFHQAQATEFKIKQTEQAEKDFLETERLISEKNKGKSWYKWW